MQLKLAKKILCEVEVFSGEKLIDKYIALENNLVTKNPLGHRPIKDIEFEYKKVGPVKYKT
jgi:hypothetical protein